MYKLTDIKNELLDVCGNLAPDELDSFINTFFPHYKEGFTFTIRPEEFFDFLNTHPKNFLETNLEYSQCKSIIDQFAENTEEHRAKKAVLLGSAKYFSVTSIPESMARTKFTTDRVCLTTHIDHSLAKPEFKSTWTKVPTEIMRKEIDFLKWALPSTDNLAFVYDRNCLKTSCFIYAGKTFIGWSGRFR